MTRSFVSAAASAFLAAVLTACGSGSSDTPVLPVAVTLTAPAAVTESSGSLIMTLTLTRGTSVTVNYASAYGSAGADDFEAVSGHVTLTAAAPSAVIAIPLKDDFLIEDDETFTVSWASDVAAGLPASSSFTVLDDDALVALPVMGDWVATGLFHPAGDCTRCHRASTPGDSPAVMRSGTPLPDPAGADISPGADWAHSLMAQALNDPWYLAKVSAEVEQHPELAGFIEDKCLNCHAPMARTQAHEDGRLATVDATCPYPGGCLRLASALADPMSREGVGCTLCHRIDGRVLTEDRHSGDYPLNADALEPLLFGPFASPVTAPMVNQLGKTPAFGAHMARSEHCASCHDLFTPVVDASTNEPNGNTFPEQTPYREWKNSDYASGQTLAAECQNCHMPASSAYSTRIALRPNGTINTAWPLRDPFARHSLVGGNVQILQVLRDFRTEIGIAGMTTVAGFDKKIADTRELLAQSAQLHVENLVVASGSLGVDARVVNLSGHKLPTGYPSRRMWIALVVRDSAGNAVFTSGMPDASGRLPLDEVLTSSTCTALSAPLLPCLMPHRDRITNAYDVPLYESVLGDTDGGLTHTLLHAAGYLKDNRLPPIGFRESSPRFDARTAVIGTGADADFNSNGSGSDTVHYTISLGGSTGPWTVESRLYLQSIRPSFIASLKASTDAGHNFRVMMSRVPPVPELLATASAHTLP